MSHYSSAPRRGYVIIHHSGGPNTHTVEDGRFCTSGYDFTVSRAGRIFVCRNNADTYWRWQRTPSAGSVWHASGCDCLAMGICMHGCFGGCTSGNVSSPSKSQECSVGYLISHLRTPSYASRVRPHANCKSWNPCDHSNPLTTVCPGRNYTTSTDWNSAGRALRDRLRKWHNWDGYGCCDPAGPC